MNTQSHSEEQAAAQCGPLREAFRRLSAEGLVQLIPNKGAMVSRLTRREVTNRYQIRIALESLVASLAARDSLSQAEQERLTLALQASREHPGTGINQGQPDANYKLHGVITEAMRVHIQPRFHRTARQGSANHLVSPAMAVAAAVTGRLSDVRRLMEA